MATASVARGSPISPTGGGSPGRALLYFFLACIASIAAFAQDLTPPAPQRLVVHSNILNEDRVVWVRMPAASRGKKDSYPVLYMTDGGSNVNEIGSTIDFLADHSIPPLIVVGIANTDRVRDLTPTRADVKESGGVTSYPTSGGADKFLDFIGTELTPEIEKRYPTDPYRIITGHSLGGLFAIHTLVARPNLFNACIASSPSLWWDGDYTVHEVQKFLATRPEFNRTLFFSLGDEGGDMNEAFEQLQKTVSDHRPKGFVVQSARYPEEPHSETELLTHYAALRLIFSGWPMPTDPKTHLPIGGLAGVEKHYRDLSQRFGFKVSAEQAINSLGYSLLGSKKIDEAMAAFERNVELYPDSANAYDSLADGFSAEGKPDQAMQNVQKAVAVATQAGDPLLPAFKRHLESLEAANKAATSKAGPKQ